MKASKRGRFSQRIHEFFNIFTFCSRQSKACLTQRSSYSPTYLMATPVIMRTNMYLSPVRIDHHHFRASIYPTTSTLIAQNRLSYHPMPQIALVDFELCPEKHNDMIRHNIDADEDDDRMCQNEQILSSSSLSATPTSSCQSSLTIHQCYSTIPSTRTVSPEILENNMTRNENVTTTTKASSGFSYLIRPTAPCVFGRETYEDEQWDDDEFFLTAGGIVHSCPNIYELTTDNRRQLQSCDHLLFTNEQTTLNRDNHEDHLNCYNTELDRYSIVPRFQVMTSSISSDSINSELELYKERHAIGLSRQYYNTTSPYPSFLPTTWRSDNYLLFLPLIEQNHHSSLVNSIDHGKRSRSFDVPIERIYTSILV